MKKAVCVFIVLLTFVSLSLFASDEAEKVNFSGEWAYNAEKSTQQEGRRRFSPGTLIINQKGNEMTIKRIIQREFDDEMVMEEKLTLDGKECKSEFREMPRSTTATWSKDGKALTIVTTVIFERNGQESERTSTEIWTLKDDGSTLSIDSTSQSPRGERKATLVYSKKAAEK